MCEAVSTFTAGLSTGLALMLLLSFRPLSPRWLRWNLYLDGLFLAAFSATRGAVEATAYAQYSSFVLTLSLALPSLFAIDQLVRHPAMRLQRLSMAASIAFLVIVLCYVLEGFTQARLWGRLSLVWGACVALAIAFMAVRFLKSVPHPTVKAALGGLVLGLAAITAHHLLNLAGTAPEALMLLEPLAIFLIWFGFDKIPQAQQAF
jgi:hypothetical protein